MSGLEYAHVEGPPLDGLDPMIWIGDIPALGARHCPDRSAIVFADRGERMSYAAFDGRCNAFAALAQQRGLAPGDRVAYLGANSDLYYPVLIGAIRAGLVLVPINWRLAAPEIGFQLADSGTRLLICDPALSATATQALAGAGLSVPVISTEAVDGSGDESLRALLLRRAPALAAAQVMDQVILQLYTSGTTGKPKGVLISHGALSLARHAELRAPEFGHLGAGCISLSAMPNFHIGGMSWVLMGLVREGTVIITADPTAANMLKLIREHRVEHSWMVPTLIRALLEGVRGEQRPAPRMKGLFYGAMAMDESLLRAAMECFGCDFLQFFGMTENTGSATSLAPLDHDSARPHLLKSVGKPYPGMSLQIRGPDRKLLKAGEHGEIWVKSPTRMLGYWKQPEKTAEALVDGWYASGDGGYVDEQGFLYLTDRIKDMIVSGGENVYPVEVEEALRLHAAVLDAGVIGLPDAHWGEKLVAVVELRPGASASEAELRTHVRSRIAGYKCPKTIIFGSLPRTASGKVQRSLLRQRLLAAPSDSNSK
ncbi:MAG: long-chain-fatty-acid--CoA ligase [Hydrocarboniphaga sp.]|uniref:class I adenylate-forming enzyme family protein n=1 Tax=Hydrocarboniphaga sp. TaxID=2033016 RepID=UPI00261202CD|nr:AMP-binding protein [Hydrocarboniphaga sp.]MDB5968336.1 long-chain-fatty-acid--CoA ligase [Hydrocarboniphaga sp.]